MTASCSIREATPSDSDDVLACLREAFEPYRHTYTPGAFADTVLTPETLARRFTTMTLLVAAAPDGAILGTIALGSNQDEGHLRGMAVRAVSRGRGIAQQLLASAEQILRDRGCHRITLDTTAPLTRAIAFYRRNGYAPTGRIQDFYGMPLHEYAKDLMAP